MRESSGAGGADGRHHWGVGKSNIVVSTTACNYQHRGTHFLHVYVAPASASPDDGTVGTNVILHLTKTSMRVQLLTALMHLLALAVPPAASDVNKRMFSTTAAPLFV